jgi:hypothetical protein
VVVAGRLLAGGAPHGALLRLRLCCESSKVERCAHVPLAVLRKLGFWGFSESSQVERCAHVSLALLREWGFWGFSGKGLVRMQSMFADNMSISGDLMFLGVYCQGSGVER